MKINDDIAKKYTTRTITKESRPGCWNVLTVEILKDGEKVGEYERRYPSLFNTFHPFVQDGKEYALYSAEYTTTRVMSLPDCKDICGEERDSFGFCPTGYAVPYGDNDGDDGKDIFNGQFGFVCGCVWGDDTGWKIQYLDLSNLKNGEIKREDWMGYVEMAGGSDKLKDHIVTKNWEADDHLLGILGVSWYRDKVACDPKDEQIQNLMKAWSRERDGLQKYEDSRLHCLRRALRVPWSR